MKTVESVRTHIKKNKNTYACLGVGLVVGAVTAVIVTRQTSLVNTKAIQILTYKSQQTIEVFVEALGDPGNITQDMTTGIIYASQGQAARAAGVTPSTMSKHIAGLIPDIKGHVYAKLGKAMVA